MSLFFLRIVNMSISAGILILAVILVRALFLNIPRKIFIVLWILVMIRLVCPLSVANPLSPVPGDFFSGNTAGTGAADYSKWPSGQAENTEIPTDPGRTAPVVSSAGLDVTKMLCIVWIAGAAAILAKAGIKTARLKRTVRDAVMYQEDVYLCPGIKSSFILGIIRARIYIPSSIGDEHLSYIIDHETEHIRHWDHLFKLLFYVIMAGHWFNPLCYIAYHLFSEDLEIACDERTNDCRDVQYRAGYMQTLLDCSSYSSDPRVATLSFGTVGVKGRVKRIMNNKKMRKGTIVVFAIVCIAMVFFLMTNKAAAAEGSKLSDDIDESMSVVIRDASGNVVETIEQEDIGQLESTVTSDHEKHTDTQYDSLIKIREEVLREGVYTCSAENGEPVYAVFEGKVVSAEYESLYGFCVTVLDSESRTWKYGHCSELTAKQGDSISTGDLIAYAGTSGITPEAAVIIRVFK